MIKQWRGSDCATQYEKTLGDEAGSLKLVSSIEKNAHHYLEILSKAVDKAMPEAHTQITYDKIGLQVVLN
jgi:DNA replication licensing factor MCM7